MCLLYKYAFIYTLHNHFLQWYTTSIKMPEKIFWEGVFQWHTFIRFTSWTNFLNPWSFKTETCWKFSASFLPVPHQLSSVLPGIQTSEKLLMEHWVVDFGCCGWRLHDAEEAAATVAVDKLAPPLTPPSTTFSSHCTDGWIVLRCQCRLFVEETL